MTVGEFLHVTQFYETVLTAFVLILVGMEIITAIFHMETKIQNQAIQAYKKQQEWLNKKMQANQNQAKQTQQYAANNQLEKEVTNYVQNEIINMEKQLSQEKQQKQSQNKNSEELPTNKQSFYRKHKAYNYFVNNKMALLMPLLILGILTYSNYIYTLAAFFFSFLCQVLVQVFQSQEQRQGNLFNGGKIKSWLKIFSVLFTMSIFISYWAVKQYNAT